MPARTYEVGFSAGYVVATAILFVGLAVAITQARSAEIAYVPLGSDNKLVLVDISSDEVIGQIKGLPAVHGLAGTPDGRFLIAGSYDTRQSRKKRSNKPSGVTADEHAAHHKAPTDDGGANTAEVSTLTILKTSNRSIVRLIDVPGAVHHVAVSPNGKIAVVTHPNDGKITAINLETYKVIATIPTGPLPNYATFSSDGKSVYISNAGNNTVSSVNAGLWIVNWNVVVGDSPEHIVLSNDGATLYINNVDDGSVSIVDIAHKEQVRTITVGKTLHGIDLSDDGDTLYVAALGDDKLFAIDLATNLRRSVVLSTSPYHLTTVPGSGKLYVSSSDQPFIWVVNQGSLRVKGKIKIGGKGHQIVVVPTS